MSADGSHLEFPICTKNMTFVHLEVHPTLSNDYSCNVCFELVHWLREEIFQHFQHLWSGELKIIGTNRKAKRRKREKAKTQDFNREISKTKTQR